MVVEKVLSSYYSLGNHAWNLANSTSASDAHNFLRWFLLDMPVVPGLLLMHSLYAADRIHSVTGGRQFWFKSYVLTVFGAFGGSTLASICGGLPPPLFTTSSNFMFGYITVAWYVIDQSRALRSLVRRRPFNALLAFGATAAKARAIFGFVDQFSNRHPGAAAGAIVLGGLSGSGGSLFLSLERKARLGFHTPSELSDPSWSFRSAYLVSFLYYCLTDPGGMLIGLPVVFQHSMSRDDVRLFLSFGLCTHAACETLFRRTFNPTFALDRLLYAIAGVRAEPAPDPSPSRRENELSENTSNATSHQARKTIPIPSAGPLSVNSEAQLRHRARDKGR